MPMDEHAKRDTLEEEVDEEYDAERLSHKHGQRAPLLWIGLVTRHICHVAIPGRGTLSPLGENRGLQATDEHAEHAQRRSQNQRKQ